MRHKRNYTPEFREKAVNQVSVSTTTTTSQIAKKLGISSGTLRKWVSRARKKSTSMAIKPVRQYSQKFREGTGTEQDKLILIAENRRLHHELAHAREEKESLKRVLAMYCTEVALYCL